MRRSGDMGMGSMVPVYVPAHKKIVRKTVTTYRESSARRPRVGEFQQAFVRHPNNIRRVAGEVLFC